MPIRLDERLTCIANLVDYGKVADVGCDHGKLGYYLIGTDRASEVIATDISAPSLQKARELAMENGVADLMQTRLGDGLAHIKSGEVDTVIIAGLGGDVISNILAVAMSQNKVFEHFVLSANTHPEKVRRCIVEMGHTIVFDDMIECGDKRYTIIKTTLGQSTLDDMQILFGAFYQNSKNFLRFAKDDLEKLKNIYNASANSSSLKQKINLLEEAIENNIYNQK